MKVKVSEQSIKHIVDNDCVDMVVEYIRKLEAENAGLRAEVAELKSQPDPLTAYLYAAELAKDEIKRLKAEVERLTKAGDNLARGGYFGYGGLPLWEDWNKAKEGKQP